MQHLWARGKTAVKDAAVDEELERHSAQGLAHGKCLVTGVATTIGYQSEWG